MPDEIILFYFIEGTISFVYFYYNIAEERNCLNHVKEKCLKLIAAKRKILFSSLKYLISNIHFTFNDIFNILIFEDWKNYKNLKYNFFLTASFLRMI